MAHRKRIANFQFAGGFYLWGEIPLTNLFHLCRQWCNSSAKNLSKKGLTNGAELGIIRLVLLRRLVSRAGDSIKGRGRKKWKACNWLERAESPVVRQFLYIHSKTACRGFDSFCPCHVSYRVICFNKLKWRGSSVG